MRCLIIDDEPLALEVLESYISQISALELVAKCDNALLAFKLLQREPVDLIFLDIQMPKLTGIDFLKALKNPPKVIITTAYRDYALQGYELEVVDYLLKPFSFDRLFKAVSKAFWNMPEMTTSNGGSDFVYLKVDKKVIKIRFDEILYIESMKDYIKVKTADREVVSHQKISYMEEKLPVDSFLRIHRSFIISIPNIEAYSATTVELGGHSIPIGRNYKNSVLPFLNQKIL